MGGTFALNDQQLQKSEAVERTEGQRNNKIIMFCSSTQEANILLVTAFIEPPVEFGEMLDKILDAEWAFCA